MDTQPSIDRSLIIPILIGGFSVIGIIVVLLIGRSLNSPAEAPVTPSATPFQYIYLGTEPAITTAIIEGSEIVQSTDDIATDDIPTDDFLIDATPIFVNPTSPSVSTPLILPQPNVTNLPPSGVLRTNTPTQLSTSTPDSTAVAANTYDDTDPRLEYVGNWVSQTDVSEAHQGTLHISTGIGNSVSFTFTGQEIHLFYQAGPSLGAVTITIDSLGGPPLSQSEDETQIKEWVPSNTLSNGNHIIVIAHFSGGSVNIDSLVVPAVTPTPTRTPTLTQ